MAISLVGHLELKIDGAWHYFGKFFMDVKEFYLTMGWDPRAPTGGEMPRDCDPALRHWWSGDYGSNCPTVMTLSEFRRKCSEYWGQWLGPLEGMATHAERSDWWFRSNLHPADADYDVSEFIASWPEGEYGVGTDARVVYWFG